MSIKKFCSNKIKRTKTTGFTFVWNFCAGSVYHIQYDTVWYTVYASTNVGFFMGLMYLIIIRPYKIIVGRGLVFSFCFLYHIFLAFQLFFCS